MNNTVFISADHGLAIVYFLQSDVVPTLLNKGTRVVVLTDDGLKEQIQKRFDMPGLVIEGLRLREARQYSEQVSPTEQWWLNYLRRVGGSRRINTEAMDSHVEQVAFEATGRRRTVLPAMRLLINLLRNSKAARKVLVTRQMRYSPEMYTDLFEKYQPGLVAASTPGWRYDRYLLRQAVKRNIPTAAVIVGWDNPSSYSIPGVKMDWVSCWSEVQKQELVQGSDWRPEQVHIGGIPTYDGYFRKQWLMSREEYFRLHGLDPDRKLLGYACSFITFSPNYQNIEPLARMVAEDRFGQPAQLLIRLHPNHFMSEPLFAGERERIQELTRRYPHVHVVEPVPLGGELGYYSGEDMPEKTSMMAYSDVFLTVYSTMVVEAAIHDRPIVSVCFDAPGGWNTPGRFDLALSRISEWPTHQRFRLAGAGRVALNETELLDAVKYSLENPDAEKEKRKHFIEQEVTFVDGNAGKRTGEYLFSRIGKKAAR